MLTRKITFHLGLPVGEKVNMVNAWKSILDKIKSKMSMWKVSTLFIGGRPFLIKSILGALGVYYMSVFLMLVTIAKKLEFYCSKFLGDSDHRKMYWVNWDSVLADLEHGGLILGVCQLLIYAFLLNGNSVS